MRKRSVILLCLVFAALIASTILALGIKRRSHGTINPTTDYAGLELLTPTCVVALYLGLLAPFIDLTRRLWMDYRCKRRPSIFCHVCYYNLKDNVSGVCPECGTPVAGATRPSIAPQDACNTSP